MKAICTSKLVVEEGAVFAGHVTVGPDAVKASTPAQKPSVSVSVSRQASAPAPQPARVG